MSVDYKARNASRKSVPKSVLYKTKPGTWLRIMWNDNEDSVVLLLTPLRRTPGELDIDCWSPDFLLGSPVLPYVVHTQVVEVLDPIVPPTI